VIGGAIVWLTEPALGREWALRAPLLFAAVVHIAVLIYALPNLNSRRIEEARQRAKVQVSSENGSEEASDEV
jgi:hypothetical protein